MLGTSLIYLLVILCPISTVSITLLILIIILMLTRYRKVFTVTVHYCNFTLLFAFLSGMTSP